MSQEVSRRNVAKSASWAIPAVAIASSAPAMAASCQPTTKTAALTFSGYQPRGNGVASDTGDTTYDTTFTFTNTGPDAIPAGTVITTSTKTQVMDSATAQWNEMSSPSNNVKIETPDAVIKQNDDGTDDVTIPLKLTTLSEIPVNGIITVHGLLDLGPTTGPFTSNDGGNASSTNVNATTTVDKYAATTTTVNNCPQTLAISTPDNGFDSLAYGDLITNDYSVSSYVSELTYGTNASATAIDHGIMFSFGSTAEGNSTADVIPADTTFTQQVCASGASTPTVVGSVSGVTITISPASGGCFNVVYKFNSEVKLSDINNVTGIAWNSSNPIAPGTAVTVTSAQSVTGAEVNGINGGTLSYVVATRGNAINSKGRTPQVYVSADGMQTQYPEVFFATILSTSGADNVVTYPNSATLPSTYTCTWTGTVCSGTTGHSIPRIGTLKSANGGTTIPAISR